jgi:hypothetical protein
MNKDSSISNKVPKCLSPYSMPYRISVQRCTNYIFQNEKDETYRIGRKFSMTLVRVECSHLELLLQAGGVLSLSWSNKICRISMENETCDIIEKVSLHFEKSRQIDSYFRPGFTDPKYEYTYHYCHLLSSIAILNVTNNKLKA